MCATPLARADAALDVLWAVASGGAPDESASAVSDALRALAAAVASSQKAVHLAKQRGAVTLLRRWLADSNEAVLELAAAAVASMASSDTRSYRSFHFGERTLRLRDASAVTGGLGWRVWRAALILCDMLAASPQLVRGRRVLEVGAGCGACGLLAAALGAADTVLTDCLPGLLETLAENIALNAAPALPSLSTWAARTIADGGSVCARHLAWEDAVSATQDDASDDAAPRLSLGEQFDVILGSDVLYESAHAAALPHVLARHLAPGGYALLVCGVRFPEVLAEFEVHSNEAGLHCERAQLAERPGCVASEEDECAEDASVTMTQPPLGQRAMLLWRQSGQDAPPACCTPPPWTHSWL